MAATYLHTRQFRVDWFVEGYAEPAPMHPDYGAEYRSNIAKLRPYAFATYDAHIAFDHHATGRQVANLGAPARACSVAYDMGQEEDAVAFHIAGVDRGHELALYFAARDPE